MLQMVKKILHYMCDDKIYTHVEDFVFKSKGQHRASRGGTHTSTSGAGRRRGRCALANPPPKQTGVDCVETSAETLTA